MALGDDGLEVLGEEECWALLSAARVGRVAVTLRAMPAIFPVNFALLDREPVFLTAEGTKLQAALAGRVVAFEVDQVDESTETGWSVLIVGHATVIEAGAELARAQALRLRPWAPGERQHFVRVHPGEISGRRIDP